MHTDNIMEVHALATDSRHYNIIMYLAAHSQRIINIMNSQETNDMVL